MSEEYSLDNIMDQEASIRAEIAASQPLVDQPKPLTALQSIYETNKNSGNQSNEQSIIQNQQFLQKIEQMKHVYQSIRFIRGDGNCFYRAYLFGLCEWALRVRFNQPINQPNTPSNTQSDLQKLDQVYESIKQSLDRFDEIGLYSRMVTEDFYDLTMDLISWAFGKSTEQSNNQSFDQSITELEEKLNDESTAQWYMTYLRCLTSLQLQRNSDDYVPFLTENFADLKSFCRSEVDSMNSETDALQILALCREIGVALNIVYLDRSNGDVGINGYVMPEGEIPRFTVIYRPGHYDILYPKTS